MAMSKQILVTQSSLPPFEEYCAEIRELWDSFHLTNMGKKHLALEGELKAYLKTENLTLFTNGHLALENMLEAYGLHGEVITTPFTFVSTTNAIIRAGLKPVFCDIDENNFTIDAEKLEDKITPDTCAVLGVHVYGNLCKWKAIGEVAKRHGLKVFYDAAHAFGVEEDGVSAANLGDCSMFSFHATKVFHTVEGGALCYRDKEKGPLLDSLKNFGADASGEYSVIGGNAKMSELHAAMGLCNLRHLDAEIDKRRRVFERYISRLGGIEGIRLNIPEGNVRHNYAYFPVLFRGRFDRDAVFEALKQNGIAARKYFYPLTDATPGYKKYCGETDAVPVAEQAAKGILCLPMYAELPLEDVDRIAEIIVKTRN